MSSVCTPASFSASFTVVSSIGHAGMTTSPYDDGWLSCVGPCWCGKHGGMRPYEHVREVCARAAHEANRVYCSALGDHSQVLWEAAPDWQRESARKGVDGVFAGNGPGASHASWLAEKVATGWKYGPVKDPEKKEHPCMVSFDQLPEEERQKDILFVATVRMMASVLGHPVPHPVDWGSVDVSESLKVTTRPA